jgi:hypothetical protein
MPVGEVMRVGEAIPEDPEESVAEEARLVDEADDRCCCCSLARLFSESEEDMLVFG